MKADNPIFAPGTVVNWLNSTYRILLTEPDGRVGMFEAVVPPGYGPPQHIHHGEDEIIYIIEGSVRFMLDGKIVDHAAGDLIFVPRGKKHAFTVTGANPARFITTVTPGGFECFFAAAAERNLKLPQDIGELASLGQRFNVEFNGPPLAVAEGRAA